MQNFPWIFIINQLITKRFISSRIARLEHNMIKIDVLKQLISGLMIVDNACSQQFFRGMKAVPINTSKFSTTARRKTN